MADSQALRSRRARQHKSGDHSLCKRGCQQRSGELREEIRALPPVSVDSGGFDPDAELRQLADQLAAAYSADPGNALLARELRMTLQSLKPQAVKTTPLQEFLRDLQA